MTLQEEIKKYMAYKIPAIKKPAGMTKAQKWDYDAYKRKVYGDAVFKVRDAQAYFNNVISNVGWKGMTQSGRDFSLKKFLGKAKADMQTLQDTTKMTSYGGRGFNPSQLFGTKTLAPTTKPPSEFEFMQKKPAPVKPAPTAQKTPDVSLGDWKKGGQEVKLTAPVGSPERTSQLIERSKQLLQGSEAGKQLDKALKDETVLGEIPGSSQATKKLLETTPPMIEKSKELLKGTPAGKALEKKLAIPVPLTPPAKDLTIGATVGTPDLPEGTTTTDTKAYTENMLTDLQNKKQAVLDMYNKQLEDISKERESAEKSIADLETKQKDLLEGDVKPLLTAFRDKLEKSERERLKVEDNFFANQKLTEEMETLLTGLQSEVTSAEAQTGLSSILTPRINKLKEDVNARVGVIQAVMNARNGQIGVANNLIDRSISNIEKDRKDQLAYYQSIYNFYGEQKDTEGKKLITLTGDQKDYIKKQISFLENEAELSQESVNYIKDAMINPQYADFMGRAGVKLTDSIPEIQDKLSTETYKQEIIELNNKMEENGYQFLPAGQGTKPSNEISIMRDSRGKEYTYWKEGGGTAKASDYQIITDAEGNTWRVNKLTGEKESLGITGKGAGGGEITIGGVLGLDKVTANRFDNDLEQEMKAVYSGKYGTEGARERALANLQAKYPGISDEIRNVIYGSDEFNAAFPDGYESDIVSGKSRDSFDEMINKYLAEKP